MSQLQSYKQLIVWQKAMELAALIYKISGKFPKEELYGLISQIRRAAVSIPSNIAEGYGRNTPGEYGQFYAIAYGSVLELETQLILSHQLGYLASSEFTQANSLIEEVSKMLHVMILKTRKGVFTQLSPRS